MRGIVDDNVDEVRRLALGNHRQCAKVHQRRAVAVQAPDAAVRLLQRDFQRNHTCMSHRPDGQEVTLVPFAALLAKLKDFAAELPRRGHNHIARIHRVQHDFRCPLTGEGVFVAVCGLERAGQRAFANDNRRALPLIQLFAQEGKIRRKLLFRRILAEDAVGDAENLQLRQGDLPLLDVLRFIVHTGFAAPADDEQARQLIHLRVHQRRKRIDGVAQPGILHIAQRGTPRREEMPGSETDRVALIRRDNVPGRMNAVEGVEGIAKSF